MIDSKETEIQPGDIEQIIENYANRQSLRDTEQIEENEDENDPDTKPYIEREQPTEPEHAWQGCFLSDTFNTLMCTRYNANAPEESGCVNFNEFLTKVYNAFEEVVNVFEVERQDSGYSSAVFITNY